MCPRSSGKAVKESMGEHIHDRIPGPSSAPDSLATESVLRHAARAMQDHAYSLLGNVQQDAQECNQSPGILSKCDDNFASFVPREMFRSSWRFFLLRADRGQCFRRATLLCRGGPVDVPRDATAVIIMLPSRLEASSMALRFMRSGEADDAPATVAGAHVAQIAPRCCSFLQKSHRAVTPTSTFCVRTWQFRLPIRLHRITCTLVCFVRGPG